ncbi:unnamed protein product [Medioppia subpectinata]|uniref:SBSPON-like C-terminal domain-containing protein n=1 Tax=Medioppia subpectinata TaxID=1979941 RepID=A0A7R9KGU7_9ACAR|nr:unnamed protein product [Medioppia subpectinata]CAG2102352.1 unnamed protein product [Medioppia subpectinata]
METALILQSSFSETRQVDDSIDIRRNLRLRYPKDPQKENSHEYCVVFEIVKSRKSCDTLGSELERKLEQGSRVCVQCQDAAMRKHLGYRCHGHGVEGKVTRWTALAGNSCHGRWVRREQYTHCPCHATGHPDFIFV